ncbi:Putative actin [Trichuris trichiura]|uniref:Putative actin n=1 Tax=Trichuris trichiura TaxID=36087 RepID=A0A077Z4G1_TRITR|nr:Putative actin [Trichuris trichiura]
MSLAGAYSGDDVNALLFDPGNSTFRLGYSGDSFPKYYLPSVFGYLPNEELEPRHGVYESADDGQQTLNHAPRLRQRCRGRSGEYIFDPSSLCIPREKVEMKPLLEDGMIYDWDMFETLMRYCFQFCFLNQHESKPIFFTEPIWNTKEKREQLAELMFETFDVPAFYLGKTASLVAISHEQPTSLVVDCGSSGTSVVSVMDGIPLLKTVNRTPLGGDVLTESCHTLIKKHGGEVVPRYKVLRKVFFFLRPPRSIARLNLPQVTQSYSDYQVKLVLEDFKHAGLRLLEKPFKEQSASSPNKLRKFEYEFPNAVRTVFRSEHYKIPEVLFRPSYADSLAKDLTLRSITDVTMDTVNRSDVELRPVLLKHLVLTGGCTLIPGFQKRFLHELVTSCAHLQWYPDITIKPTDNAGSFLTRIKIHHIPSFLESTTAAYVGASIVTSQGTFQQLWISKEQYEEYGKQFIQTTPF